MRMKTFRKFQFVDGEAWEYVEPNAFGAARFVARKDGIIDVTEMPTARVAVVRA